MEDGTRRAIKDLGYYSSLGISVALAIFIGLGWGLILDKKFGTQPVLMFVGLGMGIMAGFVNILRAMKRVQDADEHEQSDERHD